MDDDNSPPWFVGLHNLLYVSRAWRWEAERYLYTYVVVPDGKILFFCRTVLSRPDLAKRVRYLKTACNHVDEPTLGDIDYLAAGLQAMPNIRDLTLLTCGDLAPFFPIYNQDTDHWILSSCSFQLYSLHAGFVWNRDLANFVASQPQLRRLILAAPKEDKINTPIPGLVLPNCRCLSAYPFTLPNFAVVPPVTHYGLVLGDHDASDEAQGAAEIGLLGETLKVVTVVRMEGNTPGMVDRPCLAPAQILARFADKTPHVVFLGIWDYHDFVRIVHFLHDSFATNSHCNSLRVTIAIF